ASGWSPAAGLSPASTRMLWMPSAAAPRRSPCSASRLRSRQVICRIGSIPACTRKCVAARLLRWTLAPAPSVTFTAVTSPFSGSARLRNSAGSVDTGGVISAVTTNWPLRSLDCSRDIPTDLIIGIRPTMPELPDLSAYLESLDRLVRNQRLVSVKLFNPFLLRTAMPPISEVQNKKVLGLRRLGKRIVFALEEDLFLVLHLMIAGRLHWPGKKTRGTLAFFEFENGTLSLTEAGSKRRASLHLVKGEAALKAMDPGGVEPLAVDLPGFGSRLKSENHTLKRALTDPRLFAGIGNAYSDEILHHAKLSPIALTKDLSGEDVERLYHSTRTVLRLWIERLRSEGMPEKVTAFRDDMAVHGRYGKPCPVCGSPVQRIVHAENETNYCATCQTGGKLLADRALSRLLKKDWPRTLEELEDRRRTP